MKRKGEKERYVHLNAEFQIIARRDKKAFLTNQCKEIEGNNRMVNGNPLLPGEFHGQRSLVGNSPWGHKELDTTGQLTHFSPLSESPPRSVSQPKLPSLLPQVTTISTFWVFPYSFIILICIPEHRSLALYRKMTCL